MRLFEAIAQKADLVRFPFLIIGGYAVMGTRFAFTVER
jgi:hypothetical protein